MVVVEHWERGWCVREKAVVASRLKGLFQWVAHKQRGTTYLHPLGKAVSIRGLLPCNARHLAHWGRPDQLPLLQLEATHWISVHIGDTPLNDL